VVKGQVPLSEIDNYQARLKSVTAGQGSFTIELSHYDPVPPHIAQKIIERRRAEGKVKGVEE